MIINKLQQLEDAPLLFLFYASCNDNFYPTLYSQTSQSVECVWLICVYNAALLT